MLRHPHDREIVRLAVPALGALVAEPLFLLADSAIVGHLGTPQLAGLGVAGALLATAVALCVFLAYGTTAGVARRAGAGDDRGAIALGVDGMWLAAALGTAIALMGAITAPQLIDAFGTTPSATPYALTYLRVSLPGIPAMLVVLAATGVLRGLQDTRTPLVVAVVGAAANVVLNIVLVYGLDLGIGGSALGTVIALTGAVTAPLLIDAFGTTAGATPYSLTYLRVSLPGIPAMLVVLAATGVLRGLQDTRTPLVVAVVGAAANVVLNIVLVYGLDLGIGGSALGTVIAQFGMAAAFVVVVVRGARRHQASLRPDLPGIRAAA